MSTSLPSAGASGLAPIGAESLAARIADRLIDAIAGDALQPGQRLIETEIAQALGVSRMPLREALKLLEAQGILAVTPRRGAVIVGFDERRTHQICEARLALERLALRDAAAAIRADPARRLTLDRLIGEMGRRAEQEEWLAAGKADLEFHRSMIQAAGNPLVEMLWEALARHVLIVFGREFRLEQGAGDLMDQHVRLRDALLTATLDELEGEIERHIMRLRLPQRADRGG
jgi:DNA-binding GntR family transcriptional regulator